ncbi:hypothetical protein MRB53_037005 [Persea americana]|nr:hypothetical protein MRB53_037005 [Persea americana]
MTTYRCIVLRVREEDDPLVADEVVEVDLAIGGLCLEVWRSATKAKWCRHAECAECVECVLYGCSLEYMNLQLWISFDIVKIRAEQTKLMKLKEVVTDGVLAR